MPEVVAGLGASNASTSAGWLRPFVTPCSFFKRVSKCVFVVQCELLVPLYPGLSSLAWLQDCTDAADTSPQKKQLTEA